MTSSSSRSWQLELYHGCHLGAHSFNLLLRRLPGLSLLRGVEVQQQGEEGRRDRRRWASWLAGAGWGKAAKTQAQLRKGAWAAGWQSHWVEARKALAKARGTELESWPRPESRCKPRQEKSLNPDKVTGRRRRVEGGQEMCVPCCWHERCLVGMQEPGPPAPCCDSYKLQHGGQDRASKEEEAEHLPSGAGMGFEPRFLCRSLFASDKTPSHFSSLCSRAPFQEAFGDYPGPQQHKAASSEHPPH